MVPIPDLPRQKKSLPLFFSYIFLAAVLATLVICALSAQIIRSINDILPEIAPLLGLDAESASMLARIFAQLDTAELDVHLGLPALLSFALSLSVGLLYRKGRSSSPKMFVLLLFAAILTGVLFFAVSLAVSVWMTDVNDIRFGDVITSLLGMIRRGLFDVL